MDFRQWMVRAARSGQTVTEVARCFQVARSTVRDWADRHRRGVLTPGVPGPKDAIKLTHDDEPRMREAVAAQPGITAKPLMAMLNLNVVASTVGRALKRLGWSLKRSR